MRGLEGAQDHQVVGHHEGRRRMIAREQPGHRLARTLNPEVSDHDTRSEPGRPHCPPVPLQPLHAGLDTLAATDIPDRRVAGLDEHPGRRGEAVDVVRDHSIRARVGHITVEGHDRDARIEQFAYLRSIRSRTATG